MPLVQASVGGEGLPLHAIFVARKRTARAYCTVLFAVNCPRQFVVARSARPNRFSRSVRVRVTGASGPLVSVRQQKSYWVGRDNARELARNQCVVGVVWGKRCTPPNMLPNIATCTCCWGTVRRRRAPECVGRDGVSRSVEVGRPLSQGVPNPTKGRRSWRENRRFQLRAVCPTP